MSQNQAMRHIYIYTHSVKHNTFCKKDHLNRVRESMIFVHGSSIVLRLGDRSRKKIGDLAFALASKKVCPWVALASKITGLEPIPAANGLLVSIPAVNDCAWYVNEQGMTSPMEMQDANGRMLCRAQPRVRPGDGSGDSAQVRLLFIISPIGIG